MVARMTEADAKLFLVICGHVNRRQGYARLSGCTLATETGLNLRTVLRAARRLEGLKASGRPILTVHTGGGRHRANRYYVSENPGPDAGVSPSSNPGPQAGVSPETPAAEPPNRDPSVPKPRSPNQRNREEQTGNRLPGTDAAQCPEPTDGDGAVSETEQLDTLLRQCTEAHRQARRGCDMPAYWRKGLAQEYEHGARQALCEVDAQAISEAYRRAQGKGVIVAYSCLVQALVDKYDKRVRKEERREAAEAERQRQEAEERAKEELVRRQQEHFAGLDRERQDDYCQKARERLSKLPNPKPELVERLAAQIAWEERGSAGAS